MPDPSRNTVKYFCFGALFVFIGSVLFCTLGFTVVLPFQVMRSWPQVSCTVQNSTYDLEVCSCDEQISVFGTCESQYPCLKVYVSYVVTESITPGRSSSPSPENSSSLLAFDDHHDLPHQDQQLSAAAFSETPIANYSASSTAGPSDFRQLGPLTDVVDPDEHYNVTGNQLSRINVSLDGENASVPMSTASFAASHPAITKYRFNLDQRNGNASEPTTSYHIASVRRQNATDYDSDELTPTTTADVNRTYVAQLYRSWDDSFLPQCSLTECDDDTWNIKQARLFKSKWGQVGQTYSCFYNPDQHDVVILERTTTFAAVNAVVWPVMFLLVGVSLWIGLSLGCLSLGDDTAYKEEFIGTASIRIH